VGDRLIGIDFDTETAEQVHGSAVLRSVIDEPEAGQRLAADPDVLGHAHRRHQAQLLMNHRRATAHGDLTGIRTVEAGNDPHQRGLPRAVFSHQRVHRSGVHVHRHAVERHNARKLFPDAGYRDQRLHEAEIH
jgi:hypothetical protein